MVPNRWSPGDVCAHAGTHATPMSARACTHVPTRVSTHMSVHTSMHVQPTASVQSADGPSVPLVSGTSKLHRTRSRAPTRVETCLQTCAQTRVWACATRVPRCRRRAPISSTSAVVIHTGKRAQTRLHARVSLQLDVHVCTAVCADMCLYMHRARVKTGACV